MLSAFNYHTVCCKFRWSRSGQIATPKSTRFKKKATCTCIWINKVFLHKLAPVKCLVQRHVQLNMWKCSTLYTSKYMYSTLASNVECHDNQEKPSVTTNHKNICSIFSYWRSMITISIQCERGIVIT